METEKSPPLTCFSYATLIVFNVKNSTEISRDSTYTGVAKNSMERIVFVFARQLHISNFGRYAASQRPPGDSDEEGATESIAMKKDEQDSDEDKDKPQEDKTSEKDGGDADDVEKKRTGRKGETSDEKESVERDDENPVPTMRTASKENIPVKEEKGGSEEEGGLAKSGEKEDEVFTTWQNSNVIFFLKK